MNKALTIKEYATYHKVSKSTVRRRIRAGGLDARLEHGRYFIYDQNGAHAGDEVDTQKGEVNSQFEQSNDRVNSQSPQTDSPVRTDQQALIDRLTSAVDYLHGQLDKQTHLLAALTAQNSDMAKTLNPPPRPSLGTKVRGMVSRLRKCAPDTQSQGETS